MKTKLFGLIFLACTSPALATNTPLDFGKHNADEPIKVSADAFLADIKGKTGTYSGNVIVTQGALRLRADKVRVNVVDNKPDKILAVGHVVFNSASGTAQGDTGVYDVSRLAPSRSMAMLCWRRTKTSCVGQPWSSIS